ncbi:MAG TPA: acyl-CoA dehydrogenase family protein [Acidimicrobiia bacterium]|nr:acyl-CoA dehydrogenase family protein [Acidimicrobiia bacterium]
MTEDLVRDEVRSWLANNWDPDLTVAEWWDRLCDSGWAMPTWPQEWFGKGLPRELAGVVSAELRAAGAIGPPSGLGTLLAGPTILVHGTDEQRARYLRPILNGQEAWCQLFSEPGAGSDLASLQCRAERDGDEWIINGQKVWTSGGQTADLGMLVARTNPDAPKHKGITYFAINMNQPGVEVRPLREMTGRSLFSEVFFSDSRAHQSEIIGDLNGGWAVANTTLANERAGLGSGGTGAVGGAMPGKKARQLERRVGDLVAGRGRDRAERAVAGRQSSILEKLAKDVGRDQDPNIRQRLAEIHILNEIGRITALRVKAAKASGRGPGPEANTAKLLMSRITRLSRDLGLEILGANGMIMGPETPGGGVAQELALFAPAVSIYGGSDEVQKNIIGERVLGLPKEPDADRVKTMPFRELKVGTQRAAS